MVVPLLTVSWMDMNNNNVKVALDEKETLTKQSKIIEDQINELKEKRLGRV